MGCRLTGQPELYLGEFAAAREHLEQGLALFDPSHRPFYADQSLQDARVMLLGFLSQALLCLGYPDQARRQWEEAVMEARQLNQAYTLAVALGMACALEIATDMAWVGRRNFSSAAAPLADELAALSAEQEFPMLCAMGTLYRGWCLPRQVKQARVSHCSSMAWLPTAVRAQVCGRHSFFPLWRMPISRRASPNRG